MRLILIAALLAWTAPAQMVVSHADLPEAIKMLQPREGEDILRCEVEPIKPTLNFGLRFQTGFLLQAPLVQYSRSAHSWNIVLAVTPDDATEPVYLSDTVALPPILRPELTGQGNGAFVVGEGRYRVQFVLSDDRNRVCRKEWRIEAARTREIRSVTIAIPPRTVADLSYSGAAAGPGGPPAPRRVTILLNSSAPYIPYTRQPYLYQQGVILTPFPFPEGPAAVDYRSALVGILGAILEKLPGTVVRLVVFDLDLQRESLRQDDFTLKDIAKVEHAINDPERWTVDYRALQNRTGRWGLLASLLQREIQAPARSDVVLFVGPRNGSAEKMPPDFPPGVVRSDQHFVYWQYHPTRERTYAGIPPEMTSKQHGPREIDSPWAPVEAKLPQSLPDMVEAAVRKLHGRTFRLYSPADFAKAMDGVRK